MIYNSMYTVVICGRPNTGKSTLFNRLSGTRKAITYPVAGTTRDIIEADSVWQNKIFILIDTGGVEIKTREKLTKEIQIQIELALKRANLILFLVDGKRGIDKNDFLIASKLRKLKKPIVLAVNKIDSKAQEEASFQFYKLGLGEPHQISALTGKGCGDLLDKITSLTPKISSSEEVSIKKEIRVGIFGRQNVGKSSLLNAILGKTKTIVSEIPGTTRDTIDTLIIHKDQKIILVDTAGIRRKNKIDLGIEKFSIKRSLSMIEKCDIALLIIPADEQMSRQDLRISRQILENKKGVILVINKWDLIEKAGAGGKIEEKMDNFIEYLQDRASHLSWAPVIFTSAKFGTNVKQILELILEINKERKKNLTKDELDEFYNTVIKRTPPQKMRLQRKQPRVKEFKQDGISPPKFLLVIGKNEAIPPFYFNFLEKELRKKFGFNGTPIIITAFSL